MAREDPQHNIRLKPAQDATLRAAAFVHGLSPGDLARRYLEEGLVRDAKRPSVKKALEARAEQVAESEGKLTHLSSASIRAAKSAKGS